MWQETIAAELAQLSGAGVVVTRTLKTAGLSEGAMDELLAGLFGRENPYLGIYAHQEGIHLRMIARADDESAARSLIAPMEAEIRAAVGAAIWGVDDETPGHRAAELLCKMGLTLGIIEGASAGAVASQLAHIPDNGAFFKGSLITNRNGDAIATGGASNSSGHYFDSKGGEDGALAMASAARALFGSDIGLALTVPAGQSDSDSEQAEGTYYTAITSDSFQLSALSQPRLRISHTRPATVQRSATAALVALVAALEGAR